MSAALATASMGSAAAMMAMSTAEARIAQCGVFLTGCTLPNQVGRLRSRPIAKETREEE